MILKCDCKHTAQDELNGKGIHNVCKKGLKLRCTVCGKEKDNPSKTKVEVKKEKEKSKK